MMLSTIAMIAGCGFTRLVSGGHVPPWTPLVFILAFARPDATGIFSAYLSVLLVVNVISLIFDYNDLRLWLRGDRAPA
jgi:hypothetical protein